MAKKDYPKYEEICKKAHAAGMQAGQRAVPTPMVVVQRANPLDDSSEIVKRYPPVMGGVCGFAWITVRPGTSSFARWWKKNHNARKAYGGGVQMWVHEFGQSYERKRAYANAYARVLKDNGINAYAGGRLD